MVKKLFKHEFLAWARLVPLFFLIAPAAAIMFRLLDLLKTDYFLFDLKGAGTRACSLEVREHNYDAIDLYHKCEFKVTGRRKNYYKNPTEDALLMACDPI